MDTTATNDELEDLPGAFELDPDSPRLVGCGPGRLSWGSYNGTWLILRDANSVVAEPNAKGYRGMAAFLVLLGIAIPAAGEFAIWRFMAPGSERLMWTIGISLPAIALLTGGAITLWLVTQEAAKGTIFRYSMDDARMRLPRIHCVIPRSQMVRFDLISGNWFRGADSICEPVETLSDWSTELHLVVRLKSGKLVSLPLLGMEGTILPRKRGVGYAGELLSEASGIPLERVKEKTGFRNPYRNSRQHRKEEQRSDSETTKPPPA